MSPVNRPRTILAQFPFGFYFDAETGEILESTEVWRALDGTFHTYDEHGRRRCAYRIQPWELLF